MANIGHAISNNTGATSTTTIITTFYSTTLTTTTAPICLAIDLGDVAFSKLHLADNSLLRLYFKNTSG